MAQSAHIQSVRVGDNNTHCGNITGSFNFNKTVYKSGQDVQILGWLSPLEPNNRHEGVRADRLGGVGDWFLETREFREWRGGECGVDKGILFCSGSPGVGKTYLSSLVIDNLCDQARKGDIVVAGLYCDFLAQQEQTVNNMIGAILKQLVGRGDIPKYIRKAFQEGKTEIGGRRLLLPDLMGMLRMAIASLPQVFICIDALDEFSVKHLPDLLRSLRDIVRECPSTRMFFTGRPHVREDIERYFGNVVVIPVSPNRDDIRIYLEMRLDGDADPEAMNDGLRADIIGAILERVSDIFLLVSLNIDAILGEVTILQRRKKLEEMTMGNGLSDAYTTTLTRLKAQKGNKSVLGLKVLMWVLHSERPLRSEELCHALGVEVGSTNFDIENIPSLRTLLGSCLGLVTVEASSSTLRLVHYTLQEHLSSDPTLFYNPHSIIAEVCLTYLNFQLVRNLSPTLFSSPTLTPLLEYASYYWGEHTRKGLTENVKALALRLLDRFDKHISAQLLLLRHGNQRPYFLGWRGPTGFTGLHGAAFFGIVGVVAAILKTKEWDINSTDCTGSTALTWAAVRGHGEVVKIFLERGDVNPDQADNKYGQTPLWWAARKGHEAVVKMLLERGDVNPNRPDTQLGQTPLSWATKNGHDGVVKMLLGREDVNPNQADNEYGRTPLWWAARNRHEVVVKMLLERGDVHLDQPDTFHGWTPLLWATMNGHERVVRIFLERGDFNPDRVDTCGRTPLSFAAEFGHEGVAKVLLERKDVNPNRADTEYGLTPLSWAAIYARVGIVKMLLERGDINPNQPDTKYGKTPLSWAVKNGHQGVVKILLERRDINPNRADTEYGLTPLSWASVCNYEGVVKMLLKRGDVNPNQPDTQYGQTPLSWASKNGHEGVVRALLGRGDVGPDQADAKYGLTPLAWAAVHGREGVAKILLARVDVNPNQEDTKYGHTPLSWAAVHGHEEVVKILLERVTPNPNIAGRVG